MRVALIGAFLSGADMLILGEPTNHLDRENRRASIGCGAGLPVDVSLAGVDSPPALPDPAMGRLRRTLRLLCALIGARESR